MLGFVRSRRHVSRIASQRRAQEPTQFLRNENLCQCWNFLWCFVIFLTVITQSELHFCYKNIIIVVFVVGFSYKLYVFLFDLFTSTNFVFDKTSLARLDHQPGRGGGGVLPYIIYKPYLYVPPRRVGFLRRFGVKTGIHFAHFGLESGWVFEGTTGVYEHFYRFNSKWVRKKEKYANSN